MADFYEVEEILGARVSKGQKEYLVRWLGYDETEDTWEPEESLREDCKEVVEKYLARNTPKMNDYAADRLISTPKNHVGEENGHRLTYKETPNSKLEIPTRNYSDALHARKEPKKPLDDSLEKQIERLTSENAKKTNSFSERYFIWQFFRETYSLIVFFFCSVLLVLFLGPVLQPYHEKNTSE